MARKLCPPCGRHFEPRSNAAKYCSDRCRQKAHRNKHTAQVVELPGAAPVATLEATVRAELVKAKRDGTALGVHVLNLAARLDRSHDETGAALSQLDRAFRAAYEQALENAEQEPDELDAFRLRLVQ